VGGCVVAAMLQRERNRGHDKFCGPHHCGPFISFCHCCVESKRDRIRRVKYWKTAVAMVAAVLSASLALAEDFKTIDGKEYKTPRLAASNLTGLCS